MLKIHLYLLPCLCLLLASTLGRYQPNRDFMVHSPNQIVNQTDWPFLGISIDTSLVTGGYWWQDDRIGEHQQTAQLRLDQPELLAALRATAPVHLRLGGTEADRLYLGNEPLPAGFNSQLGQTQWQQLLHLTAHAQGDLLFNLGLGPMHRLPQYAPSAQLQRLAEWRPPNSAVRVNFELGNESNGHFFFFGVRHQLTQAQYAHQWRLAHAALTTQFPESLLLAKGAAFWPWLGEVNAWWAGSSQTFWHQTGSPALSWHYYPSQSFRCGVRSQASSSQYLLSTQAAEAWQRQIANLGNAGQLWLTEIGPAQCGGDPSLNNSHEQSLWWLIQMGLASQSHQRLYRQTIQGASYGLFDAEWQANLDWHAMRFWQRHTGPIVLAGQQQQQLWLFNHCREQQAYGILINSGTDERRVRLPEHAHWLSIGPRFQEMSVWQSTQALTLSRESLILIKYEPSNVCLGTVSQQIFE